MKYKDEEINVLSYNLATIYDKRTYCEFYISLLKTKHNLIFSFCNSKDYNSRIIKIDLFFIGFTTYYTVNALFYNDDTMHNIYVNKGSFDFEHQIPIIIYSSLISMIFINKRGENLKKILQIKFIFYFIISFIFLLCFWYYISIFGVIYKNTQYHLLKDTLISFGLSMIYPFGIYILPGIFRIPALSNNKRKCLYDFSKLLQIF